MFGDMGKLMKQVTEMKSKMGTVEKELKNTVLNGVSRDACVMVEITGKMVLKSMKIVKDDIIGDKKKIEKAFFEATEAALNNASNEAKSKLSTVTGGIKIPGIN